MGLFFIGMVLLSSAWAQQQLSATVVTASAIEEDANLASERVATVSRAEIEAMGAANVQEVLLQIPGVHLLIHPATQSFAQISMQGLGGSYVKVLIDGVEVAGDIGGVVPLDMIPVGDVERIEVLQGASSALYGSDALGGVINIITRGSRSKHTWQSEALQRAGSNGTLFGDLRSTWKRNQAQYRLSTSYDYDNGSTRPAEDLFGNSIDLYPMPPQSAQQTRLSADWHFPHSNIGYTAALRHNSRTIRDATKIESAYDDLSLEATAHGKCRATARSDFEADLSLQSFTHRIDQYNLDWSNELGSQRSTFLDGQSNLRWIWRRDAWNTVLLGTYFGMEELQSEDFPTPKRTASLDVYAQDMIAWNGEESLLLVPGLRYTSQLPIAGNAYDGVITPKLSMRWLATPNTVVRTSYGMGYRRPTLKQKFWVLFHQAPYNFLLRGNPELKPERSHGVNASVEQSLGEHFAWNASTFANYLFDLIDDKVVDPAEGTATDNEGNTQPYVHVRSYVNTNEAFTVGGSLGVSWRQGPVKSSLSYSRLVAKDKVGKRFEDMTLQVPHSLSLRNSYRIDATRTTFFQQAQWNARQLISTAPRQYSPDYMTCDFSVWQDLGKSWQIFAMVENIFDNWHPQSGTATQLAPDQESYYGLFDGRVWHAGAKFQF